MKSLSKILYGVFLLITISFAQQINIHTINGTDVYNLSDIDSITFTLNDTSTSNSVTDIDGNVYKTVKIGDQVWMAENLKVTHYRNGDAIPNVTDNTEWANLSSGAYCAYNNDNSNVETYGLLYNWYAVDDNRKIAPEGWHVATDEEWKQLEMYIGMSDSEANDKGWRGTNEGDKLKETGTTHWAGTNSGATNEYNFNALPSGFRHNGTFYDLRLETNFWTATEINNERAWYRLIRYNKSEISRNEEGTAAIRDKSSAFSVRCVRD